MTLADDFAKARGGLEIRLNPLALAGLGLPDIAYPLTAELFGAASMLAASCRS